MWRSLAAIPDRFNGLTMVAKVVQRPALQGEGGFRNVSLALLRRTISSLTSLASALSCNPSR
jgi:hypothetical protein